MRIAGLLGTAALLCAALLGTGTARADGGQMETGYQNPVTALPPVSAPATPHCTVTAMQQDFGNTISSPPGPARSHRPRTARARGRRWC
ncbi:hypothetical protein ACFQZC_04085 [Streptacidiphilus monticola]